MNFDDKNAIYLQIARIMCDNIMAARWLPDERIVSVRDLAVELEVNPNTAMRSYEHLQNLGIIYNRRGIGYFVAPDGPQKVKTMLREEFMSQSLPSIFKTMLHLDISMEELIGLFNSYKTNPQNK